MQSNLVHVLSLSNDGSYSLTRNLSVFLHAIYLHMCKQTDMHIYPNMQIYIYMFRCKHAYICKYNCTHIDLHFAYTHIYLMHTNKLHNIANLCLDIAYR